MCNHSCHHLHVMTHNQISRPSDSFEKSGFVIEEQDVYENPPELYGVALAFRRAFLECDLPRVWHHAETLLNLGNVRKDTSHSTHKGRRRTAFRTRQIEGRQGIFAADHDPISDYIAMLHDGYPTVSEAEYYRTMQDALIGGLGVVGWYYGSALRAPGFTYIGPGLETRLVSHPFYSEKPDRSHYDELRGYIAGEGYSFRPARRESSPILRWAQYNLRHGSGMISRLLLTNPADVCDLQYLPDYRGRVLTTLSATALQNVTLNERSGS